MGASVPTTHDLRSGTFTADLMYAATDGLHAGGLRDRRLRILRGNKDHRDFSVTAVVTFQEHGKQTPTALATSCLISL